MELEQSQDFNARLSQWVANQGFWFQVRYSITGTGTAGTAMFHLLKLMFRLLVFALILAVGGALYLTKRTGTKDFHESFTAQIQEGLSATKAEVGIFSRDQGLMSINKLICDGGADSFYTKLDARNIRGKMSFIDGVIGKWNLGVVSIFKLNLDLNAGADDALTSQRIGQALFKQSNRVLLNSIDISDATITWGYSDRTNGSVENSALKIQRQPDSMKLSFKGGTFSQNWLKKLEIIDLVIDCTPEGFTFEKAQFRQGVATVDFSGLKVAGGERPVVSGVVKIRRLPLENALPFTLRSFLEGSISGDFNVTGSSNSTEGIGFSGLVILGGQDSLTLRERLPILKALSDVDYVRNYYRVNFTDGSFELKTNGGTLTISDLKLKADDLLTMDGHLNVRLPTPDEARAAVLKGEKTKGDTTALQEEAEEQKMALKKDDAFSLTRAGKETKRAKEAGTKSGTSPMNDRLNDALAARQFSEQAAERASRTLLYEGEFRITLPPDAFELAPKLLDKYPLDRVAGRIPLLVPIDGDLYDITAKQADEIYQLRSH